MRTITSIRDLNDRNLDFWKKQQVRTNKLLGRSYVLNAAVLRETKKSAFALSALSEAERIDRTRGQKSFEWELEQVDAELAPRRIFLAQQERAKKPRYKITENEKTLFQVIVQFVSRPEHQSNRAKILWKSFYHELRCLRLRPKQIKHPTEFRKWAYEYDFKDGRRKVTFGQFANLISESRQKSV